MSMQLKMLQKSLSLLWFFVVIYYFSTHHYLVPPTIKPDGFWHLLQPKNHHILPFGLSLSLSLSYTHSLPRFTSCSKMCAPLLFLKTHCPWANDSKELLPEHLFSTWDVFIPHTNDSSSWLRLYCKFRPPRFSGYSARSLSQPQTC